MWQNIISFWFTELSPKQWFMKDPQIDELIRQRFFSLHQQAITCELCSWRNKPLGRLAEIIVLDQFSRNFYRDSHLAFAHDSMALVLAQEAVQQGDDLLLNKPQRQFLYMPYMHSESPLVHEQAEGLFAALGEPYGKAHAKQHRDIIDRFGRYPHRNTLLGRTSSTEELDFLRQPGSSF